MSYKITLIPGDGIGPEVTDAVRICFDALNAGVEWETALAGEIALQKEGCLLPQATLNSIRKNKIAIKGPITTPIGKGFRSVNVALRQELELYACLRPSRYIEGTKSKYPGVDIIIVRENSEDLYAGVELKEGEVSTEDIIDRINAVTEKKIRKGSALTLKPISEFASRRVIKFAFELARREKRGKVTCAHKANIMKYTDGLFLKTFYEVSCGYRDIEAGDVIVDNLAMQLVINPLQFDVLVLPNLYGDIISDLCAGLVGGLGLACGANIGDKMAVFEPVHGSAPKYAGKNKVNPTATILSSVLMLRYLGEMDKAKVLETAVFSVIKEGKNVTYDLKPRGDDSVSVGTKEMTLAIAGKIKEIING